MPMTITNSSQLLSQIAQNKGFRIGDDGQLSTQSSVARFFSKIGDVFKSWTTAGKIEIAARNAAIEAKMLEILSADEPVVPNLAAGPIDMGAVVRNAPLSNDSLMNVMLPLLVKLSFEPAQQPAALKLVQRAITKDGEGILTGPREDLANAIAAKTQELKSLHLPLNFSYGYDQGGFEECGFHAVMNYLIGATFIQQSDATDDPTKEASFFEDNIHENFIKDANRRECMIEGEYVVGNERESILEFTNDMSPTMTRFVSTVGTQAGITAALTLGLGSRSFAKDFRNLLEPAEMMERGLAPTFDNHHSNYHRVGNMLYIHQTIDIFLNTMDHSGTRTADFAGKQNQRIAGRHYEFEVAIDLSQDMTGKKVPDYTLTGSCRSLTDAELV